jgi:hypothetical protein
MSHKITLLALAALTSASALACPGATLQIRNLNLNAEGVVTRSVYVRKMVESEDGGPATAKLVPIVRDSLKIERGDALTLNAAPSMVDASLFAEIKIKEQDRDAKGILSTTYHVVEVAQSSFGGVHEKAIRHAYLATVKSNYLGNGTYSRGCGEVIKTDLDLESSTDVHH